MLERFQVLVAVIIVMATMFFITYLHDQHLKEYKSCMIKVDSTNVCLGK